MLALLQILRDTEGLELPSGAVLISPVRLDNGWIYIADHVVVRLDA